MVKRLIIAVVLVLAVFSAAGRLPTQSCTMSMPASQKMDCGDCCAKMKSCALPQRDQTPPATASTTNQPSIALIATAIQTPVIHAPVASAKISARSAGMLTDPPPRLAVLCTFLI